MINAGQLNKHSAMFQHIFSYLLVPLQLIKLTELFRLRLDLKER